MGIQHPVFFRPVDDEKIMVMTVVDRESLPEITGDCFIIGTTERNPLSLGNPTITLNMSTVLSSEKYVNVINKADLNAYAEDTKGNSPGGIFRGPYWFIKKIKTLAEQLYW